MYQDRLQTNRANGARFYPYGDEITSTSNDREKFATYTRDSYTGLDYADQRYYASTYGRFNTPDPYMASGGPGDPGSWNRYSYTKGDPVNRVDPSGRDDCDPSDPTCSDYCDPSDPACSGFVDDSTGLQAGFFSVYTIGCGTVYISAFGGPGVPAACYTASQSVTVATCAPFRLRESNMARGGELGCMRRPQRVASPSRDPPADGFSAGGRRRFQRTRPGCCPDEHNHGFGGRQALDLRDNRLRSPGIVNEGRQLHRRTALFSGEGLLRP